MTGERQLLAPCAACFNAHMTNPQSWWLTMPPAEVAATVLAYFSSASHVEEDRALNDIVSWWKTGQYRQGFLRATAGWISSDANVRFQNPDVCATAEAIQILEHAALIRRAIVGSDSTDAVLGLTRLGRHALQTNTVRQHLGLSDAAPTQL
jgi:hypothetical protein